jgi:sporulation protein YlmC with PRC-barrel domain
MPHRDDDLQGKPVFSGSNQVGILRNITVNVETGELRSIHVEPYEKADPRAYPRDAHGRFVFPVEAIREAGQIIILHPNR